jgi:hypothetical protein
MQSESRRLRTVSGRSLFPRKNAAADLKTPGNRQPSIIAPVIKPHTLRHSERRKDEARMAKRRRYQKQSPPRVDLAEQFSGKLLSVLEVYPLRCEQKASISIVTMSASALPMV